MVNYKFMRAKIFIFLILTNIMYSLYGQGCSGFNIKKESEIASVCAGISMTMIHDILGKDYLYEANKEAGLKVYDISNSSNPNLVKTIPISALGNLYVMNLAQSGSFLYLALGNHFNSNQNAGKAIIDVLKPEEALVRDFWDLPSSGGGSGIIKVEGNYVYLRL